MPSGNILYNSKKSKDIKKKNTLKEFIAIKAALRKILKRFV